MSLFKKGVILAALGFQGLLHAGVSPTFVVPEQYKATQPAVLLPADANAVKKDDGAIVLEAENLLVLNDQIDEKSVSKLIQTAIEKSYKLPEGQPLYLFLSSPGGDVVAGNHLLSALRGLGREVKTITSFSASMAFITVQGLGERIVMEDGVLMSHRARGGMEGQFPGELDTQVAFWKRYIGLLDEMSAKRIGITAEELLKKHYDEWWTEGPDAVAANTADRVAHIRCGRSLVGTKVEEVNALFFVANVTFSLCPLVQAPIKVEVKKGSSGGFFMSDEKINDYVDARFSDKRRFLREYIMTNKFKEFLSK